jgi:hypothetical protein
MSKWVEVKMSEGLKKFVRNAGKDADRLAQNAFDDLGIKGETQGKTYLRPSVRTGRLRGSFHWENHRERVNKYTNNRGDGFDSSFQTKPQKGEVKIGTNVIYAERVDKKWGYMDATFEYLKSVLDSTFMKHFKKMN